jgi:hypothetical protein
MFLGHKLAKFGKWSKPAVQTHKRKLFKKAELNIVSMFHSTLNTYVHFENNLAWQ